MDTSDVYPELFGDALSYSSQRMAQLASLVTAAATVMARRKARRNAAKTIRSERALRELQDQERAAYELARAGWAPARDPRFLDHADLLQAARVWSAAAAYADADPEAADAVRACEQRLRALHPYAMAWYDRLRREGATPLDAMREALPLFARAPHARPGDPVAERPGLAAPDGLGTASRISSTDDADVARVAADSSAVRQAERRGQQIMQELQARTLAERGYALSPDELETTLGATTTLPGDVIARLARADSQDRMAWGAERTRADDLGSASAASFPDGLAHGRYLTAAAQDRLTADTAAPMPLAIAARRDWQPKASHAPPPTRSPQRPQAQSRRHHPPSGRTRRCISAGPAVRHETSRCSEASFWLLKAEKSWLHDEG